MKEYPMTSATFTHSQTDSLRQYIADVSQAARAFAAALFAAQERQFIVQEVRTKPSVSERAKAKARAKLFSMAGQYEHSAPSLCAELRFIACRD
jgi:hypothetical protein